MFKLSIKSLFASKHIILIIFLLSLSVAHAKEVIVKKINVLGEQRLSEAFIKNFVPKIKNNILDDNIFNDLTKNLYMTGFFSEVKVNINNNILEITVKEYPIINKISFSGNDLLEEDKLSIAVSISPREIFNKEIINDAIEKIQVEYQKIGRYLADVNVKKINLPDGRVNIVFQINEGSLLLVKNINFIGNKVFSDNDLKSKISTKEAAWYKLWGSNKYIPERIEYDKDKLREFYNERGYIDFKVELARGDLLPDLSGFNINFVISEGTRYLVNDISFDSSLIDNSKISLIKKIDLQKGDYFNSRALEQSITYLTTHFVNMGYSFAKVKPNLQKQEGFVNIIFKIVEGTEKYINKIIIVGNSRTNDSVIRRELSFVEGDSFNKAQLLSSIKSLNRLGYFESVNYRIENKSEKNIIDVVLEVKETNTGSVSFGVGYSSLNNTTFNFGLNEKNFLGEGKKVRFEATLSEKKSMYNIGITEPYYLNRPLSLSSDIYNQETENTKGDIKSSRTGFGIGLGVSKKNVFQKVSYNYSASETTTATSSTAASSTGEEGIEIITSSISHTMSKDTRDNIFNPSSGHHMLFQNTFAGIGGDATFVKSVFRSKSYYPINYGDYTFGFKTGVGVISALDEKITSSNRFFLGGKKLKGFTTQGVGPRDTGNNQAIGGNNFYNMSFELRSDKWLPDDTGLKWLLFSDIGSIWGTDYETGVIGFDDIKPRITNGFGVSMSTPVGPLQMFWGFPLEKESYDLEENFQFSIGTNF